MNSTVKYSVIAALFLLFSIQLSAQTFKAGAALRKITPESLLPISGGMGYPETPVAKAGELFARAIVLQQGETTVAIVSVDNLGWPAPLGDVSRQLIPNIAPENILIAATHTHSAPDAYGFADRDGNLAADLNYLQWSAEMIAEAVNEAYSNLQPANLKSAVGEARGKIAYNYYADILYDPRCGVIQAFPTTGNETTPIFTLVNYAIHPEILGTKRLLLSPDLCGPLYDRIEEKTGGMAIFVNGALGGMITADNRMPEGGEANSWEECIRIGTLLADEALRIIEPAPLQLLPTLYSTSQMVEFPIESEYMREALKLSPILSKASGTKNYTVAPARLNLLNIGQAQIITAPGEAMPNIGYYLKRKQKTTQPMLFGLVNDSFGYIITKEDFGSFRRYDYISRTALGEMTGEIYINEAIKLIESAPESDKP